MELKPLLETAVHSTCIGIILKLADAPTTMRTDPVFQEVLAMSESFNSLDLGAKFNYVLLMFSTGKVCSLSPCTRQPTGALRHDREIANPITKFDFYFAA